MPDGSRTSYFLFQYVYIIVNLQDRVKELWNLSIIKADILRRLGQNDRNLMFNMVTRTSTEQVTPVPRANVPIISVASILSEPPGKLEVSV